MELNKAIEILKSHNEWRRGADMPMTDPKVIGEAIDTVIEGFHGLTWQDIQRIVEIADELMPKRYIKVGNVEEYPYLKSQEAYYTEVLKRFNEKED